MYHHEFWMQRCIDLAQRGELTTAPNPMVGAVIVYHDAQQTRVLGEGYHRRAGEPHAEVHAIRNVKAEDRPLLPQSTIYVNLEPCSHYGKTPPCCDLIIRSGIRRCVVGCVDPYSKVGGRGIMKMKEAGIEVIIGVLREKCIYLNRRFFCVHTLHRPFITLKWAASADGFMDRHRQLDATGQPIGKPSQLSNRLTQMRVHRFRANHQAILVGRRTFELDLPSLNVRHWAGHSPLKCVLGRVDERALREGFQAYADIDQLLNSLREAKIQSLFVEGGHATLQSFIERDLWDEAWEEQTSVTLQDGIPTPSMPPQFRYTIETHFDTPYRHWKSPILEKNYVDF